jgi:hypothetical protein
VRLDDRRQVSQERAEPSEINRICLFPDDLVSKDFLALVLRNIEVILVIESLAADDCSLGGRIKKAFYLRCGYAIDKRSRDCVHVPKNVNERLGALHCRFGSIL